MSKFATRMGANRNGTLTTPRSPGRIERRLAKKRTVCQWCSKPGAERYHQRTQYVEEERNYVTLCKKCRADNDEHWADMWSDYYSGCL